MRLVEVALAHGSRRCVSGCCAAMTKSRVRVAAGRAAICRLKWAPVSGRPPAGLGAARRLLALRREVQAYSDAFLAGDVPASWAMLSNRCRDRMPMADWEPILRWARGSARV